MVITGPSGVGKDSLLSALKQLPGEPFGFPANATTRAARPGERDGIDYHFLTSEEFARQLAAGEFLEHATVYGQEKGVLKQPVRKMLETGLDVILRTDIQGARYIKSIVAQAVTIFVEPPSMEEMERRMLSRGGDSAEQVALRLETAKAEMASAGEFDYTVINDNLDRCVREIVRVIEYERSRADRSPTVVE